MLDDVTIAFIGCHAPLSGAIQRVSGNLGQVMETVFLLVSSTISDMSACRGCQIMTPRALLFTGLDSLKLTFAGGHFPRQVPERNGRPKSKGVSRTSWPKADRLYAEVDQLLRDEDQICKGGV